MITNYMMLNPSDADEKHNDPTVARCEVRTRALSAAPDAPVFITGADFSEDRRYRYRLYRYWRVPEIVVAQRRVRLEDAWLQFLATHPQPATQAEIATRFRRRREYIHLDGYVVTNMGALVSTDPKALRTAGDPIGPKNDEYLLAEAQAADMVVCAWGAGAMKFMQKRAQRVVQMLREAGVTLHVLRLSKQGVPWHPLYLPYSEQPKVWTP